MKQNLVALFKERFLQEPLVIKAPGRINIIGEHTDYNEGFVLPAAIDKAVYVAIAFRDDEALHFYAKDFDASFSTTIHQIEKTTHSWVNYILGVMAQFVQHQHKLNKGLNILIASDLPNGAGVSSSAALSCGIAFGINALYNFAVPATQLAQFAQGAEHEYAGVRCGIMDQFASLMGKENCCIKLDCKTLAYEHVPLQLQPYTLLLLNTNVKHSLADSAYNTRRQECETGVAYIQKNYPTVHSLRTATMSMIAECIPSQAQNVIDRCSYVVQEIERLNNACIALQENNLKRLGQLMIATHYGLKDQYLVSCEELDYLVEAVQDSPYVLGSRMMGGGFGGCTINIIEADKIETVVTPIAKAYQEKFGLPLTYFVANIGKGVHII
jgi:galactokinase